MPVRWQRTGVAVYYGDRRTVGVATGTPLLPRSTEKELRCAPRSSKTKCTHGNDSINERYRLTSKVCFSAQPLASLQLAYENTLVLGKPRVRLLLAPGMKYTLSCVSIEPRRGARLLTCWAVHFVARIKY
jgi:hypothetical protein